MYVAYACNYMYVTLDCMSSKTKPSKDLVLTKRRHYFPKIPLLDLAYDNMIITLASMVMFRIPAIIIVVVLTSFIGNSSKEEATLNMSTDC